MSNKNLKETSNNISVKERNNIIGLKEMLKGGFSERATTAYQEIPDINTKAAKVRASSPSFDTADKTYETFEGNEYILSELYCTYDGQREICNFIDEPYIGTYLEMPQMIISNQIVINKYAILSRKNGFARAELMISTRELIGGGLFKVYLKSYVDDTYIEEIGMYDMNVEDYCIDLTEAINKTEDELLKIELVPDIECIDLNGTALYFNTDIPAVVYATYAEPTKRIAPRKEIGIVDGVTGSLDLVDKSLVTYVDGTFGNMGIGHIHNSSNNNIGYGKGFNLEIDDKLKIESGRYTYTDIFGNKINMISRYYYTNSNGDVIFVEAKDVEIGADGILISNGKRVHREVISEDGLRANFMNNGVKNAKYIEERQSEIVTLENAVKNYKDALNEYVKTKKYVSGDQNNGTVYEDKSFALDENDAIGSFEKFFKSESGWCIMSKAEANNYRSLVFQKMSLQNTPDIEDNSTSNAIKNKQIQSIGKQIEYMISNSGLETPNELFKQYILKKNELAAMKLSVPVALLKDGDTVKGYNEDGRLVAIYTSDGNTAAIERDMSGRAVRMYDSKDSTLDFTYNADGYLTSISDENGNFTEYTYDANGYLIKVIFPNNDSIEFAYDSAGHITSIVGGKYKTVISYSGNAVTSISKYALFSALANGVTSGSETLIETVAVSGSSNNTDIQIESVTERYEFNSSNDYSGYLKEIDGKVVEAERYTYRSGEESKTEYAELSSLNTYSLSNYSFVCGESETIKLNAFNLPIKVTKSGKCLDVNGSTKTIESSVADYTYNAEQKPVKIITEVTTKKGSAESKRNIIERFSYDGYGRPVKSMRYVEGEEEKNGVSIEVSEYGEDGNVKTYSYNTLSSSNRIVNGSESKEEDISVIYGLDRAGNVNSVNGDNGGGEANVSDATYTHGLLTRVKSGSTEIKYGYDHKGRVKSVSMNGVDNYLSVNYSDKATEDGKTVNKVSATLKGDKVSESVYDLSGNLVKVKYNGAERVRFNYDSRRRLSEIKDSVIKYTTKNTYDTLDRLTKYEFTKDSGSTVSLDNVKEEYTYNNDGLVSKKVETIGSSVNTYTYSYDNDSEKKLIGMSVGSLGYGFEYDGLKRKRNKKITVSGNKIADERISYRRDGESATVNIAGIRYGNVVDGKFVSGEGIKYVYDENGNIAATYVNGALSARYRYDRLSRLVREDNKGMNKTYTFEYDDSGNITYKGETAFTLAENLDESSITLTAYGYDGDRLMRFGNEICEYDGIGNPTKYRSKTLVWSNGRELTKYDSTTFTYDGEGRRASKNSNRYAYSSDGRLVKESRGIEYIYDSEGVAGIKYSGATYHMQKNGHGDVIMLLDNSGKVVVRYTYDAWGNHTVQNPNGTANTDANFIGNINPIRYRSYYYDTETGLYFLKSRYYDPKTGRFISIDDISYIDTNTVNGINLYAYCLNNPVMMVDPSGCWSMPNWLKWLIGGVAFVGAVVITALTGGAMAPVFVGMGVSIVSGGIIQGAITAASGGNFIDGLVDGMADGALWGGVAALGGAMLRVAKIAKNGIVIGESMTRVNGAAKQIGAATYHAPGKMLVKIFGGKNATSIALKQNQAWISRMMKWGVKITDIGINTGRIAGRSAFYAMEATVTNGYWNLIKMFWPAIII